MCEPVCSHFRHTSDGFSCALSRPANTGYRGAGHRLASKESDETNMKDNRKATTGAFSALAAGNGRVKEKTFHDNHQE